MANNVLNTDLTGKVAVVTGAGGVLCSAFSKALAKAGAKVALLGRTLSSLQAVERRSAPKAVWQSLIPAMCWIRKPAMPWPMPCWPTWAPATF